MVGGGVVVWGWWEGFKKVKKECREGGGKDKSHFLMKIYLIQAFGGDSTQEEVYNETTKHLVQNVIEGYNATVFAYGATGLTMHKTI